MMDPDAIREGSRQRPEARNDPRLDWWRDAKFGMFIHWGLYAIPAGEWKGERIPGIGEWIMLRASIPVGEYEKLPKQFNPIRFDAAEWVALAKAAGQKYLIVTSKHHDGFSMYDSKVTEYDIVDSTPFGRDPLAELAAECARQGIRFGFYYSQTQDWHHPDGDGNDWDYDEAGKDFNSYVEDYVKPQVRELLTRYGPVAVVWFDTPKRMTLEQSQSLRLLVNSIQPDCLVNGRVGNHTGDYASARDNAIPGQLSDFDWETPATINDTWGYKRADENWKPARDLIRKLVDIVSKGGNYLLNVGPTADGVIPSASSSRLLEVGEWLRENGESIYGTRPGPIQGVEWCRSTVGTTADARARIYLHVLDWPIGGRIELVGLGGRVAGASLLVGRQELVLNQQGDVLTVLGPAEPPDPTDTVIVLEAG